MESIHVGSSIIEQVLDNFGTIVVEKHLKQASTRRSSKTAYSLGQSMVMATQIARDRKDREQEAEMMDKAIDLTHPPALLPDKQVMKYKFTKDQDFEIVVPQAQAYQQYYYVNHADFS